MHVLFITMQFVVATALLMIVLLQIGKKAKSGLALERLSHRTFCLRRRLGNGLNKATTVVAVVAFIMNVLGLTCIFQP